LAGCSAGELGCRWRAIDADSDLIEAKAVVLVVPEQRGQALRTELHDVLIPVDS
jgi:hypothetical protein